MSSKLEKLIAHYEAERANLTNEMEDCVVEMDYSRVSLFAKNLLLVKQQLRTLYNIRDKRHDEKQWVEHLLAVAEKKLVEEAGDNMQHYYTGLIAEQKARLARLTHFAILELPAVPVVRAALTSLLTGKITGCTLVFRESQQLDCHLRLVRKTLILTVPEVRRHRANCTLVKEHIRHFKRLGFRLYDNKNKLMLFAPYSSLEDVNAVQRILARITFEVFYFKELSGETFIKYHA